MSARLQLFPDQRELKADIYSRLRSASSVLAQACTGFGKSALAVDFCLDAVRNNKTVTINVPRRELARQMSKTLNRYQLPHGFIASGMKPNPFAPVQISLTETLARRLDRTHKTDLLIPDECHVGGESLSRIVEAWKLAGRKLIGLSATPRRMDGRGMDTLFDDMACGPQMRWLIDNGRLNQYKVVVSDEALKQAQAAGASEEEIDRAMFGDAVETYQQHAHGLRTLVFCRTIRHAEDVAAHYTKAGIPSAAISSKTPDDEMQRVLMAFARREILCLMNVQVASFGWDLAQLTGLEATVECVQMLRFSSSLPLYMQIAGRFLRVSDRVSVFIDHTGVIFEHGLPCAHREWTLAGELKGIGEQKEKLIPTRQCPIEEGGCGMVHKPSPACPRCGRVYPVRDLRIEQVESDMVMLTPEEFALAAKGERRLQGQAQTFEDLLELEKRKGNARGWAERVYTGRGKPSVGLRERRVKWQAKQK